MSTSVIDERHASALATLAQCAETFAKYAEHHLAKGDFEKATANLRMFVLCQKTTSKILGVAE